MTRTPRTLGPLDSTSRRVIAMHASILGRDLHFTARTLRHSRAFALTAILVTALGVGANTAALSVADFVLVRPLPFPRSETLVRLCEGPRTGGGWGCNNQLSPANYRDFAGAVVSVESMGAFSRTAVNLVGAGDAQRLGAAAVTPEVLPLLGVRPMLGRGFDGTDGGQGDARSVVLGHGLWTSRFGRDPNVVGRTVNLDGIPYEVIGVMPPAFRFPTRDVQLWTVLVFRAADFENRGASYIEAVGRLADGATFEQARAELSAVAERLVREYPDANAEMGISFFRLRDEMSPRYRVLLLALGGAGLCTLLLTCATLANLLLARAAGRERELAVRAALGAGRERLIRQMITESVVLAMIGGAAGVLIAGAALPLLARLIPSTLPIAGQPSLDWRVLTIAALVTGLTGIGFGLFPALRAGGQAGFEALRAGARAGGGRKQRIRGVLVTVEVAMSVALLITAGLLVRAIWRVQAIDAGFRPRAVLTMRTALPRPEYDSPVRRGEFYQRVLSAVRALPGVESAAYIGGLPMVLTGGIADVIIPGRELRRDGWNAVSRRFITPQFFGTMGIPLVRGRDVDDGDTRDRAPVAVVSEAFAERHWPGEDPIGRTFELRGETRTVVGVVGDIRVRGLERRSEPQIYLPAPQVEDGALAPYDPKDLVIRFSGSTSSLVAAVRGIIRAADPEQPVSDVRMLEDIVAGETAPRRALLRVLGALAGIALLLSGVGIHGLLAYTVSQRSHEIGVRLALGAEPAVVARMVLSQGMVLATAGIAAGVLIAYVAARAMGTLLFGVEPGDPATIGSAAGLAVVIAFTGAAFPALRAMRVSPLEAMRAE